MLEEVYILLVEIRDYYVFKGVFSTYTKADEYVRKNFPGYQYQIDFYTVDNTVGRNC